jgi:hypothetical protein
MAYIEPLEPAKGKNGSRSPSRSRSNSAQRQYPPYQNRSNSAQTPAVTKSSRRHHHHHHHRHHHANGNAYVSSRADQNMYDTVAQPPRSQSKYSPAPNNNNSYNSSDAEDDTKQYLKMLIDEMQAMKLEMNRMRQLAVSTPKGRSDSIQADIKDLRSHIDLIRARIAMTPKITAK